MFGIFGIVPEDELVRQVMDYSKAFYSPHEVAEMAGVHPSTILNYIASGRLYAVKLSARTFRIPVRSVIGLLEPERLAPSTRTDEPDAVIEVEIEGTTGKRAAAAVIA